MRIHTMISPHAGTTVASKKVVTPPKQAKTKVKKLPRRGYLYRIQYCPNPHCLHVNSKTRFPDLEHGVGLDLRWLVKHEKDPENKGDKKIHPLYKELAKIRGLKEAYPTDGDFGIQCIKVNEMFTWEEILPKVLKAIKTHVARKRKMVEIALPQHPSPEEMRPSRGFMDW